MNKEMRKNLETVVDAIINEDNKKAKSAFHEYLRAKTQSILAEAEDESEDDGAPKKGKNPFAKSKKDEDDSDESDSSDDSDEDDSDEKDEKDEKDEVKESLALFNKESSRARKAKNGPTTPVKKKKVAVGCQDLGAENLTKPKKVRDIK